MTPTNEAGHGLPEVAAAREVIRAYFAGELDDTMILNLSESLALSRGVPADMVLVPIEPTEAMIEAGWRFHGRAAYEAMVEAAPAAAGAQGEEYAACCDTPAYCSSVRRCTRMDAPPQPAAADGGVRERARELLAAEYAKDTDSMLSLVYAQRLRINDRCEPWAKELSALEQALTEQPALSSHRQAGDDLSKFRELAVTDEMVERACKKYAFREDGAIWPDAYSEHEVTAERALMREFLEHVLALVEKGAGNG